MHRLSRTSLTCQLFKPFEHIQERESWFVRRQNTHCEASLFHHVMSFQLRLPDCLSPAPHGVVLLCCEACPHQFLMHIRNPRCGSMHGRAVETDGRVVETDEAAPCNHCRSWLMERAPTVDGANQPTWLKAATSGRASERLSWVAPQDMNGIIHNCTHGNDPSTKLTEGEMIVRVFNYLDRLVQIVQPRQLLFMAIDGAGGGAEASPSPAPRACRPVVAPWFPRAGKRACKCFHHSLRGFRHVSVSQGLLRAQDCREAFAALQR